MSPEQRYFVRFLRKSGMRAEGDVLDLGCGDGALARVLAQRARSLVGIDTVPHSSWERHASDKVTFRVGDAEALEFEAGSFDSVIAVNMLHHTRAPERALAEMVRVCRPGGTLWIAEPNRVNPLGYVHLTLLGKHDHFTTARFLRLMRGALPPFDLRRF